MGGAFLLLLAWHGGSPYEAAEVPAGVLIGTITAAGIGHGTITATGIRHGTITGQNEG